jgi:hypothetical protein
MLTPRESSKPAHVDLLGTIACVMLALITLGFAAFRFAPVLPVGASRNVDKAFFSSINLTTLTGFTQSFAAVSEYPAPGQWMITLISFASAATLLTASGVFLARVFGIEMSLSRMLAWAIGLLLACWVVGATVSLLNKAPLSSVVDAASATTGLGLLSVHSASRGLQVLLVTVSVPASIGLMLLLTSKGRLRAWKRIELLEASWIALGLIYLLGMLLLKAGGASWLESSLLALDARSLGTGFVPVTAGGPTIEWTTAGLMLLGAGPGGVAGGLSVLPIVILVRSGLNALRSTTVGPHRVADPIVGVAVSWFALFSVGLAALVLGLAATQPQLPGDRMLFLAISAISNVGLSHDPVSLSREGLYLLGGAMLFGRALPLVMLCWMACVSDASDRIEVDVQR